MTNSKKTLFSLLIFVISYLFFLLLWLQIKDSYGKVIATIASNMTSFVTGAEFKGIIKEKDKVKAFFIYKGEKWWSIGVELLDINIYTFNAPFTLAIMAGLFLFIKRRWRAYSEAVLILSFMHILHVFIIEIYDLSSALVNMGIKKANGLNHPHLWHTLAVFVEGMVIWFVPFLIGVYLYLRFSDFESE